MGLQGLRDTPRAIRRGFGDFRGSLGSTTKPKNLRAKKNRLSNGVILITIPRIQLVREGGKGVGTYKSLNAVKSGLSAYP